MCKKTYQNQSRGLPGECKLSENAAGMNIPLDPQGYCIFHSHDLEWKQKNDFQGLLHALFDELNGNETIHTIDFREFVFPAEGETAWRLDGHTIAKPLILDGAVFRGKVVLDNIRTDNKVNMKSATFHKPLKISNSAFQNINLEKAQLAEIRLSNTTHKGLNMMYAHVSEKSVFEKMTAYSYCDFSLSMWEDTVNFLDCRFKQLVNFGATRFRAKNVFRKENKFEGVTFTGTVDFEKAEFTSMLTFKKVHFLSDTSFVDAAFVLDQNVTLGMLAAVNFLDIYLGPDGVMEFKSTDSKNKLFANDVYFKDETIEGTLVFENANFNKIDEKARLRLLKLQKDNNVVIGKGCLKYRHQTKPRTLHIKGSAQNLVLEIVNTYTSFFIEHHGMNLGFEILERDEEKIEFFYFSDEPNMTQQEFEEKLGGTEHQIWNIVQNPELIDDFESMQNQLLAGKQTETSEDKEKEEQAPSSPSLKSQETGLPQKEKSALINKFLYAKDLLVNMMSSFFKIGTRAAYKDMDAKDLQEILKSIHFDTSGMKLDGQHMFQVIVNNYNQTQLVSINKNNQISIEGHNNTIIQDTSHSDINTKKS